MTNLIPGKLYKVTREDCFGYAIHLDGDIISLDETYREGYVDLNVDDIIMYITTVSYNDMLYETFLYKTKLFMQRNVNTSYTRYLQIQQVTF